MNGYNWQNGRPHSNSNSNSPTPLSFQNIQHLYPEHFKNNSVDQLNPRNYQPMNIHSDNNSYADVAALKYTDESIPLSLTAQELTLQESKTYMRWYSDILARTNSRTVSMKDVFNFLNNFKIPQEVKDKINKIFFKILSSINIGEFFALLRLISHALQGQEPVRNLIKIQAPVPTPPSILSKKRQKDDDDDDEEDREDDDNNNSNSNGNNGNSLDRNQQPLDIDSFTQFLLTGERPSVNKRSKKLKSVKFSDQIDVHDASLISPSESPLPMDNQTLDYSLPMDQLLSRMKKPDEEEKEVLKDMESQMNHFQHLNTVDTMSVGGTPYLQPNMTGPAQMTRMFSPSPEPLRPNVTGPADMARMFSPPSQYGQYQEPNLSNDNNNYNNNDNGAPPKISLSAFSSQMTGSTLENTIQNSGHSSLAPIPPPSRLRSSSSPLPNKPVPPPPPPSRRNRVASSSQPQQPPPPQQQYPVSSDNSVPPPLPPKIAVNDIYSTNNDSTANILDDLKALQEEVDKIRDLTGGF